MNNETTELVEWLGDMSTQSVISFKDGAQGRDAADFFDELIATPKALGGFFQKAKSEAASTTDLDIDALWAAQVEKLKAAGVHPMAAQTIISGLKTAHFGYAWAVQSALDEKAVSL